MDSGAQTEDMVTALSNGQVVAFTSESSKTIAETVKARSRMLMVPSTKVNGKTTKEMEKEPLLGLTTQSILACLEMI